MDDNHLTIGHRSGHTLQIFRSDGTLHPGHYNNFWNPFVGRPTLGAPNGVTVGNHAIQIGNWRIHEYHSGHLSIYHSGGKWPQIFRSDGNLFPNQPFRHSPFSGVQGLGAPSGVTSGTNYIQIGKFRIGCVDPGSNPEHLSVAHGSAASPASSVTSQIYRADGALFPGPHGNRAHYSPWYI